MTSPAWASDSEAITGSLAFHAVLILCAAFLLIQSPFTPFYGFNQRGQLLVTPYLIAVAPRAWP